MVRTVLFQVAVDDDGFRPYGDSRANLTPSETSVIKQLPFNPSALFTERKNDRHIEKLVSSIDA